MAPYTNSLLLCYEDIWDSFVLRMFATLSLNTSQRSETVVVGVEISYTSSTVLTKSFITSVEMHGSNDSQRECNCSALVLCYIGIKTKPLTYLGQCLR